MDIILREVLCQSPRYSQQLKLPWVLIYQPKKLMNRHKIEVMTTFQNGGTFFGAPCICKWCISSEQNANYMKLHERTLFFVFWIRFHIALTFKNAQGCHLYLILWYFNSNLPQKGIFCIFCIFKGFFPFLEQIYRSSRFSSKTKHLRHFIKIV